MLVYFRGGPKDGQLLEFKDEQKPPNYFMAGRRCNAMYKVNPGPSEDFFYADFERLMQLPSMTASSGGTTS